MKPLRYTVAIINEGREPITVDPFKLADLPEATVAVGEVFPTGRKSMAPYYCHPKPELSLSWRLQQTGELRRVQTSVALPKRFAKVSGSAIVFHIKPEEGSVSVSYEILDPKTGRLSVIWQGDQGDSPVP